MQLDSRSTKLLKELLLYPGIKTKKLTEKLNLSRSQINYSIEKINDWLSEYHYPIIKNDRELGIIVDPAVRERFPEFLANTADTEYIPSVSERVYFITIMLLSRQEELSLFHISDALLVSRNTIIKDMKKIEATIVNYNLSLVYTRRHGYFISGDEFDKRKLLIDFVPQVLKMTNGFWWLTSLTNITKEEVLVQRSRFEQIEYQLKKRFTDEKLEELPITFLLLLRRIRYGKKITLKNDNYNVLTETKEYLAVKALLLEDKIIDEQEHLYITLQLLSSSVFTSSLAEIDNKFLQHSIHSMLIKFEKLACVTFQNIEELAEKIYQHMKPAAYRIKYHLQLKNPLIEQLKKEYGAVHHLVKQSVHPIENFLENEISDDELGFITILIISWLQEHGNKISNRPKAVVICPNGISVSKLLIETLREMFPEIVFVDNMSVREFEAVISNYDLVFSTVLVKTDKKLFLVEPFITKMDKENLKKRVYQTIFGVVPTTLDYRQIINVIKKHATIEAEDLLIRDLKIFFDKNNAKVVNYQDQMTPVLSELLTEDRIILKKRVTDWREAIRYGAEPLLRCRAIGSSYIESICNIIEENEPYMFIAPGVAIPHARPEDGVNKISMSMLRLKEPVEFSPGLFVKVFIVIAAIDKKSHLKALSQLSELTNEEKNVKQIEGATTKQDILELIEKYSQHKGCG